MESLPFPRLIFIFFFIFTFFSIVCNSVPVHGFDIYLSPDSSPTSQSDSISSYGVTDNQQSLQSISSAISATTEDSDGISETQISKSVIHSVLKAQRARGTTANRPVPKSKRPGGTTANRPVLKPKRPGGTAANRPVLKPKRPGGTAANRPVLKPKRPGGTAAYRPVLKPKRPGGTAAYRPVLKPKRPGGTAANRPVLKPKRPGGNAPNRPVLKPKRPGGGTANHSVLKSNKAGGGNANRPVLKSNRGGGGAGDRELRKICSKTENPKLCISTVAPRLRGGGANARAVLDIAIKASYDLAKAGAAKAKKLAMTGKSEGIEDCKGSFDDALSNFDLAIKAFQKKDVGTMNSMLSAVVTDMSDCVDSLGGEGAALRAMGDKLATMTSNCLGIISQMH